MVYKNKAQWSLLQVCILSLPNIKYLIFIQKLMFLLKFLVPPTAVSISTSSEGTAVAGQRYIILCTVTKQNELSVMPEITWLDSNGMEISGQIISTSSRNTTDFSSSVEFNPLLTSHGGIYVCQVSLSSATLSLPLNSSAVSTVTVQSMTNLY